MKEKQPFKMLMAGTAGGDKWVMLLFLVVLACMGGLGPAAVCLFAASSSRSVSVDRADVAVLKTPLAVCFFKGKNLKADRL